MIKKDPLDKWLYPLVIIMGIYFLIRIIDQAKMINLFPLVNNDLGSYVAQLYMLKTCGFHNSCPYWYNGFVTFLTSPPGWEFFTYPLYLLFNNILLATYASSILMYIIGFIFIYYLGRSQNFSLTKRTAFFILMFANSISIGNFILVGRMPSLNATIFFLGLATIVYFYKSHKIDKKFVLLFVPINILVILSHYQEAILAELLILSLFLIKKGYERVIIVLSFVLSLLLSAFWWLPFLFHNMSYTSITRYKQGTWFTSQIIPQFEFTTQFFTSLLILIIPLVLFVVLYFYLISKRDILKKELLFYSPIMLLAFLFLFRVTAYIPVLEYISPDPFLIFFLFFIWVIFFKTNFDYYPKTVRVLIIIFLILLPIANVVVSHTKTQYWDTFEYKEIEKETLSLFKFINPNEKFVFVSTIPSSLYSEPCYYYAYATVYNDLSTPEGYYYHIAPYDYRKGISKIREEKNCENIENIMLQYNTNYAISYRERCDLLESCGFKKIIKLTNSCLYKL